MLTLLPLAAALIGCDREPAEAEPVVAAPEPKQQAPALIFLGDSLTAGHGLTRDQAMPALIQRRIDAAGLRYRVINAGRSGDTTAGGLARLDWYFEASPQVAGLVIGLGSNDAMRGLSVESMEENLRKIVQHTRRKHPKATIFLWALETFPNLGPDYVGRYREVFPRLAEREGLVLLPFPLAGVAARPELNQPDGIHPNVEGTERVAENVWNALERHL